MTRRDVLVVVDVQNDFCPGGSLGIAGGDAVVAPINRLGRLFENVVLTQDWHPPGHTSFASSHTGAKPFDTIMLPYGEQVLWPDHCVQGTAGAAFHPDLDLPHAALIIRKGIHAAVDSYSTFFENDHATPTGLAGYLRERGLERVFLAGLATDYCVRYSASDARREGFAVVVVEDASRPIASGAAYAAALAEMRDAGAAVVDAAAVRSLL